MPVLSIAGAGTDIGKTYVAAALVRALIRRGVAVDVLKPVASGLDDDAPAGSDPAILAEALGRTATRDEVARIAPFRFKAPLSPPMAATREGRVLRYDDVLAVCRARVEAAGPSLLIVETAGGVMSPVDDDHTMLDLMAALGAPVVLVGGTYLGAISHALTARLALQGRGLAVPCLAVSESPGDAPPCDETVASLKRFTAGTAVSIFHRDGDAAAPADALAARVMSLF